MPKDTFFNLKEPKKATLMAAIIDEVSRVNYESINIQNIIKDAHIARGSFYQYFIDKADMYEYVMTYIGQKKKVFFKDIFENQDLPFIDKVEALYMAGLAFKKKEPKLVKAGEFIMVSSLYQQSEVVKNGLNQVLMLYETWIKIDQDKGLIDPKIDAHLLSNMMMELLNKLTMDSFIYNKLDEASYEKSMMMMLSIFKKGIEHV